LSQKTDAKLHIFDTPQALGEAAAAYVSRLSAEASAERGRFMVALSGGSLPKLLCPPLAAEPLRSQIDWSAWHVFWADERLVPLNHADSNFRLARTTLFNHVGIPVAQIYPVDDSFDPAVTAEAYQAVLAQVFEPLPGQYPRFDLILLGMGEDGHTASLFPYHPLLNETHRWVAAIVDSPKPPPERITLTLPVINNARHVAFVTAGAGKAKILARVLQAAAPLGKLPAQLVQPTTGELSWFVDEAAADKLRINR
jgi:6-phosphogluconolactonase